jgi:beta-phosphoglucomutase
MFERVDDLTMNKLSAFLFDLNGTMIDDMPYHIEAWYNILKDLGSDITFERTKHECYGKNHELLERVFPGRFTYEQKDKMSFEKEKEYQKTFRPKLKLLNGLHSFLKEWHEKGVKMAIGSAAITFNIDFVLDGTNTRQYFDAVVSADNVSTSKPNPETFLKCAQQLHVLPEECIVFEDTPKGVEAALNAGMKAFVITTLHQPDEFERYENVLGFANDFTELSQEINKYFTLEKIEPKIK